MGDATCALGRGPLYRIAVVFLAGCTPTLSQMLAQSGHVASTDQYAGAVTSAGRHSRGISHRCWRSPGMSLRQISMLVPSPALADIAVVAPTDVGAVRACRFDRSVCWCRHQRWQT